MEVDINYHSPLDTWMKNFQTKENFNFYAIESYDATFSLKEIMANNESPPHSMEAAKQTPSSDCMVNSKTSSVIYFNTLENNSENDNANCNVDHEGRPTMKTVTNSNQPNLPPLSEYNWQNMEDDIL